MFGVHAIIKCKWEKQCVFVLRITENISVPIPNPFRTVGSRNPNLVLINRCCGLFVSPSGVQVFPLLIQFFPLPLSALPRGPDEQISLWDSAALAANSLCPPISQCNGRRSLTLLQHQEFLMPRQSDCITEWLRGVTLHCSPCWALQRPRGHLLGAGIVVCFRTHKDLATPLQTVIQTQQLTLALGCTSLALHLAYLDPNLNMLKRSENIRRDHEAELFRPKVFVQWPHICSLSLHYQISTKGWTIWAIVVSVYFCNFWQMFFWICLFWKSLFSMVSLNISLFEVRNVEQLRATVAWICIGASRVTGSDRGE